jgi:hypothetical protein
MDTIVIKEKRTHVTRSNEQNGNNKLEALEGLSSADLVQ